MLEKYFEIKTREKSFEENFSKLIDDLKGKKVIIFGRNKEFLTLNKKYKLDKQFQIVAITDGNYFQLKPFAGIRTIPSRKIENECYDEILIISSAPTNYEKYLSLDLMIDKAKIKSVFKDEIKDECQNLNYLYKYKFDKTLPQLIKKLNGKKVMLYGAGVFLELIKKYFDISALNIVGIADKKFCYHEECESFLGYKAYSPDEIKDSGVDCVLVATKMYINIIEDLYYKTLKDTKIKIKPLLKKDFFTLLKEM